MKIECRQLIKFVSFQEIMQWNKTRAKVHPLLRKKKKRMASTRPHLIKNFTGSEMTRIT